MHRQRERERGGGGGGALTNPELLPAIAESDLAAFLVAEHAMDHTQTSPAIS